MKYLFRSFFLIGVIGSILCRCAPSSFQIDADFPGGNIMVMNINGDTVQLQQDLRDTEGHWFYWSFRIRGAAGRTLNFKFTNGTVLGSRGPAVSNDGGLTWRWLSELGASGTTFQYHFGAKENEVYFSGGMNYTEKDLHRFLIKYKNHPDLTIETLCTSRKGRKVELLRIHNKSQAADYKIFLSSRHHCGEMMATRALEGIMEVVLADTEEGRWFRSHADFFIVPFVDKDGVEDGDQGKNRRPHDHNRDYIQHIYPEIRAITEQVPQWSEGKPLFFFDLHCPWIREGSDGNDPNKGTNEFVYFVGRNPEIDTGNFEEKLLRFSSILETAKKGAIPYKASYNLLYGKAWNTASNIPSPDLLNSAGWGATLPNAIFSSSIEIPFANASGVEVNTDSARKLGYDLAKAIRVYLENY